MAAPEEEEVRKEAEGRFKAAAFRFTARRTMCGIKQKRVLEVKRELGAAQLQLESRFTGCLKIMNIRQKAELSAFQKERERRTQP